MMFAMPVVAADKVPDQSAQQSVAQNSQPTVLVGVLSEQWDRVCNGTQEADWIRPHLEAGFVRLIPNPKVKLKPFLKKTVVLRGHVPKDYKLEAVKDTGECPALQARSDWIFGKTRVRLWRNRAQGSKSILYFQAAKAEEFTGLKVKKVGDKLEVTFENVFSKPLPELVVTLHYEGCYGKPGSFSNSKKLGTLAPGQKVTSSFGLFYSKEMQGRLQGMQHHFPYSIQITTLSKEIIFDFDWPLRHLGIKCPDRQGRKY